MAVTTRTRTSVASPPVAALEPLPPGPELATALAALDRTALTGFDRVLVLKAQQRQTNHEAGLRLRAVVELLPHADVSEVRAALLLTRRAAKDLCELADDLAVRLPTVLDAMISGVLDEVRGKIFHTWTGELCQRHTDALVHRLLPIAARLSTARS